MITIKEEYTEIPIDEIVANSEQPRAKFDEEKLKELADSIKVNGLINPITVRKDENGNGKYIIVAGERRWRAHKIAGLKTIKAFVKNYVNGEWMVESLIENIHREDLGECEKADYINKLMKTAKVKTHEELAKMCGISESYVDNLLALVDPKYEHIAKYVRAGAITARHFDTLKSIDASLAKQIANKVIKENLSSNEARELVRALRDAPDELLEPILKSDLTPKQAEKISKLKTKEMRVTAIKEHKAVNDIKSSIEYNVAKGLNKPKNTAKLKKQLQEAKVWLTGFRGHVTQTSNILRRTLKSLVIATKFVGVMDDTQKARLNYDLARLLEILNRTADAAESIK